MYWYYFLRSGGFKVQGLVFRVKGSGLPFWGFGSDGWILKEFSKVL